MPQDLDDEMQLLWDEGHLILMTSPIDREASVRLCIRLRDCAVRARNENRRFGARLLEKLANDLAVLAEEE